MSHLVPRAGRGPGAAAPRGGRGPPAGHSPSSLNGNVWMAICQSRRPDFAPAAGGAGAARRLTRFVRANYNAPCVRAATQIPPAGRGPPRRAGRRPRTAREREDAVPVHMELKRIIISEIHEQQVVMLKEVDGDRSFSIMIGIFEATSIDRRVKRLPSPRPLTHDLVTSVIENMGGELRDIYLSQ